MRADKFFAEKFGSRSKAKQEILKGAVLLDGVPVSPDDDVSGGEAFSFVSTDPFVSRGGDKLEKGLKAFGECVTGCTAADLGASTGGFTDCLLRRGAKRVYCVDVGENQLDEKIASDGRVVVMDHTNARFLTKESFPEPVEPVVADLSFISLRLVLGAVRDILPSGGRAFVLFKPQFECEGQGLGKSGVLPKRYHRALLSDFYAFCNGISLAPQAIETAPVYEKKNVEYVVFLKKDGKPVPLESFLRPTEK